MGKTIDRLSVHFVIALINTLFVFSTLAVPANEVLEWSQIAPQMDGDFAAFEAKLKELYPAPESVKDQSYLFPPERVAIIRTNIQHYVWAQEEVRETLERADALIAIPWKEMLDSIPTPNMLRRANGICPHCHVQIYARVGTDLDIFLKQWKGTCPTCGKSLPGFDAKAYFLSGRDPAKRGYFDHEKADKSLLPEDPAFRKESLMSMESYCYTYWARFANDPLALAKAYRYTGNKAYGRRALLLLARFTEFYPYFRYEDTPEIRSTGAMISSVWEGPALLKIALVYASVWDLADDPEVLQNLNQYRTGLGLDLIADGTELKQRIEGRIFGVIDSERKLKDNGSPAYMRRIYVWNYPRHYACPEIISIILGDTPLGLAFKEEAKEFYFGNFKADGSGIEGSIAYDIGTFNLVTRQWREVGRFAPNPIKDIWKVSSVLAAYELYFDLLSLGRYYPNFGDAGTCGSPDAVFFLRDRGVTDLTRLAEITRDGARRYAIAFNATGRERLARIAWFLNDRSVDGLHLTLADPNPEEVKGKIEQVISKDTSSPEKSILARTLGLIVLKSGEDENRRALWIRANDRDQRVRGGWHGHADSLNLGLFGYGLDLLPDVGYMDQKIWIFGHNSISLQDSSVPSADPKQLPDQILSRTDFMAEFPGIQVARCRGIKYTKSHRTAFLVDVDEDTFYVVDSVRLQPDIPHKYATYAFHSNQGKLSVPFSWQKSSEAIEGTSRMKGHWIPPMWDAPQDKIRKPWSAEIALEDTYGVLDHPCDVKIRFTALRAADRVFHTFYAPPEAEPQIPRRLPYLFMSTATSRPEQPRRFTSIIEPFRAEPGVHTAQTADTGDLDVDVIQVDQTDGRQMTFIVPATSREITLADGTTVKADAAIVATRDAALSGLHLRGAGISLKDGTELRAADKTVTAGLTFDTQGTITACSLTGPIVLKTNQPREIGPNTPCIVVEKETEGGFTTLTLAPKQVNTDEN